MTNAEFELLYARIVGYNIKVIEKVYYRSGIYYALCSGGQFSTDRWRFIHKELNDANSVRQANNAEEAFKLALKSLKYDGLL